MCFSKANFTSILGASNVQRTWDTSEYGREDTMEEKDFCDTQHHFSSLTAAAAQIRTNSLFSAIDPGDSGRAPMETVVDYLESVNGLSGVYHLLTDITGGSLVIQGSILWKS